MAALFTDSQNKGITTIFSCSRLAYKLKNFGTAKSSTNNRGEGGGFRPGGQGGFGQGGQGRSGFLIYLSPE